MSKYRSLADIYSDNFRKPVTKLQRQVINEDVKIYFQSETDNGPVAVGSLPDDQAAKIKRQILNSSDGVIGELSKLLVKGGWGTDKKGKIKLPKNILSNVLDRIENNTNINKEGLKNIVANKNSYTNFEKSIQTGFENFNIVELLIPVASEMLEDNVEKTVIDLIDYAFKLDVMVGKGELAITMFSNSSKGKKGDLYFPDSGEVELKGTDGRPGKTGNAALGVLEFLPALYKTYGIDNKRVEIATKKTFKEYQTARDKILKLVDHFIEKLPINNYDLSQQLIEFRKSINEIDKTVSNDEITGKTVNQLIQFISQIFQQPENQKYLYGGSDGSFTFKGLKSKGFIKLLEDFQDKIGVYKNVLDKKEKSDIMKSAFSSEIILDFFNDNKLGISLDDKIRGFLSLQSEESSKIDKKSYESGLRDILNEYEDILISKDTDDNGNSTISSEAESLIGSIIAAMQIAMYGEAEKFSYIVFYSNKTYDAISFPMLKEPKSNFLNLFEKIKSLNENGRLALTLDLDPHYGTSGIKIAYKG